MGRRGPKRQLDVEARYWELLAAGVGTVEACRAVGITRKTGYRWRAERGGLVPLELAETARSNRYLSALERRRIATLRSQKLGVREIARRIGRDASTVSRELRRNRLVHDRDYDADLAHARARERARRPRRTRLSTDPELRAAVQGKLELEWSPEQIAGWLRATFPLLTAWHVCHETIYQALYHGGRGGLSRTLTKRLRTGRPLRKRRRRPDRRRVRYVIPSKLIDQRPPEVEGRGRLGDWEGDLIIGRGGQSAVGTLVERRTGLVRLVALPDGHSPERLCAAITPVLEALPESARRTLTWDQGSEMARHDRIAPFFSDGVFFAYPASPWLRGSNENANGLLRQYLPKRTDLNVHDPASLARIEDRLNGRPRKRLGWASPAAAFTAALAGS
ncbi:IS30 family transposase [Actinomycetospora sp. CA-101289]|uniref:IS30 family transposase n=1 Tax=Actinomycetospora sp. CA-101289 TaxID=3239893 RepID=UPI003D96B4E8